MKESVILPIRPATRNDSFIYQGSAQQAPPISCRFFKSIFAVLWHYEPHTCALCNKQRVCNLPMSRERGLKLRARINTKDPIYR